jgi:hypothetical protein
MGYKFTLVLSREITEEEVSALKDAGCPDSAISMTELPTAEKEPATQLEFDTEASDTLAGAMEMALDAVKAIPDLRPFTLEVPAQPNGEPPETEDSLYELDPVPAIVKGEVEDVRDVPPPAAEAEPAATPSTAAEAEPVPATTAEAELAAPPSTAAEAEPVLVGAADAEINPRGTDFTTEFTRPVASGAGTATDNGYSSSHTV